MVPTRLKSLLGKRPRLVPGLRSRFIILGVLAVLPIVWLEFHNADTLEHETLADAHTQARIMVGRANGAYDDTILQTRTIVEFLATAPEVRTMDVAACGKLMKATLGRYPSLTSVFVKDLNGDTICNKPQTTVNTSWNNKPYFQQSIRTKSFAASNFFIGPISHKPIIAVAQPVLDDKGNVIAVVGAGINLTTFNATLADHETSADSVTIFDGGGNVIGRYPDSAICLGADESGTPLFRQMKQDKTGEIETAGLEGENRIFAFQPFANIDSYIAVGIPTQPIVDAARGRLIRNLLLVAAVLLGACGAAGTMFDLFLVRPAKTLSDAAIAMGEGDYDAASRIDDSSMHEISRLMVSFRKMARRLHERETELRDSEQSAIMLNRNMMLGEQIANAGYWKVEYPSQKLTWSNGVWRIFGQNPRSFDLSLASAIGCFHPDDRQHVAESVELAFALQRDFEYTVRGGARRRRDPLRSIARLLRESGTTARSSPCSAR